MLVKMKSEVKEKFVFVKRILNLFSLSKILLKLDSNDIGRFWNKLALNFFMNWFSLFFLKLLGKDFVEKEITNMSVGCAAMTLSLISKF